MTTDNHIAALERRHSELERQLEAELRHAAQDEMRIAEIKRKKLVLKDELAKFQHSAA